MRFVCGYKTYHLYLLQMSLGKETSFIALYLCERYRVQTLSHQICDVDVLVARGKPNTLHIKAGCYNEIKSLSIATVEEGKTHEVHQKEL